MKKELADFAKSWSQLTPLRRIGAPDDVAAAVEFLLSDRASHMKMPGVRNLGAKEGRFNRGKTMLRFLGSDLQAYLDDHKLA